MERTIKVFVYGTLRKGERNHHYLKDAELLSEACWTYGTMIDTGNNYPALLLSQTNRAVGELYAVNKDELKQLDYLEGYKKDGIDNLYERITKTVYTTSEKIEAYVYIMHVNNTNLKVITSGDWKQYRLTLS